MSCWQRRQRAGDRRRRKLAGARGEVGLEGRLNLARTTAICAYPFRPALTASPGQDHPLTCREVEHAHAGRFTAAELWPTRSSRIRTRCDTPHRSAVSVGLTVILTLALCLLQFGTDPEAFVRAGFVTKSSIMISMIISGLLTAVLSYRSALVMRELTRTRAELPAPIS